MSEDGGQRDGRQHRAGGIDDVIVPWIASQRQVVQRIDRVVTGARCREVRVYVPAEQPIDALAGERQPGGQHDMADPAAPVFGIDPAPHVSLSSSG